MALNKRCDLAIVGGGLSGALIAHALAHRRRDLSIRLIEPGPIGGNHLWSFFDSDVAHGDRWIVAPFIGHRWKGYDVAFPGHRRQLKSSYNSIRSHDLADRLPRLLPPGTIVTDAATEMTSNAVTLQSGVVIDAGGVIDARGAGDLSALDLGWQKFVGQELRLAAPHALERPVLMDATVAQEDGYRFIYLLPLAPDRIFVEDTYYSDGPDLDRATIASRIAGYAEARGWTVAAVESEEAGSLPVAMGGDFDRLWGHDGVAKAGMRAGLFHPVTGYSLPDAVRLASLIVRLVHLDGRSLHEVTRTYAAARWRERGFYRMLSRMLFRAAEPKDRYRVLERFYTLSPGLIERFYAARSGPLDKVRILAGKPPVPIDAAIRAIRS
ncbi:lycopene beta-cyclase CrtY [Sphingomonas sp. ID0503]|uniref:lycopene beta-cyclase CrtY n=1 Tax=Sphingomonas sp. ID0503 TaxID=3399691 RepID=UPI003AFA0672